MATTPGVPQSGGEFTGPLTVSSGNFEVQNGRLLAQGSIGRLRLVQTGRPVDDSTAELLATGGDVSLRTASDAGVLQTEYLRCMRATGEARLTGATSVTVPAATAATHAAQVSAIDADTGRLAIGGIELGDTSWRDISSVLLGTWTADTFQVRRKGDVVEFRFENLANGATTSVLSAFNAGFRPVGAIVTGLLSPTTTPELVNAAIVRFNTSGNMFADNTVSNYGQVSFMTTAAWPTSLPGTPGAAAVQLPA